MRSAAPTAISPAIATMRPPEIATSRTASSRPEGSMTRPPLIIRSYLAGCAADALGPRTSVAAPAAAADRNRRRLNIVAPTWLYTCGYAAQSAAAVQRLLAVHAIPTAVPQPG